MYVRGFCRICVSDVSTLSGSAFLIRLLTLLNNDLPVPELLQLYYVSVILHLASPSDISLLLVPPAVERRTSLSDA